MAGTQSDKRKIIFYEAQFRIKVTEYAIDNKNCRAAEHFGVAEKYRVELYSGICKTDDFSFHFEGVDL